MNAKKCAPVRVVADGLKDSDLRPKLAMMVIPSDDLPLTVRYGANFRDSLIIGIILALPMAAISRANEFIVVEDLAAKLCVGPSHMISMSTLMGVERVKNSTAKPPFPPRETHILLLSESNDAPPMLPLLPLNSE